MKRLLSALLAVFMMSTFTACENKTDSEPVIDDRSTVSESSGSLSESVSDTVVSSDISTADEKPDDTSVTSVGIIITSGETVINAVLDDSGLAKEFAALLPQTVSMTRVGGGREFYGRLQGSLNYDEADSQTAFENGDLAYWFSGNGLCLLYNNQVEKPEIESGIIVFGKITSDLSVFFDMPDNMEFTVALAE